ncbi:MAG: hypothetical protein JXA57_14170 [Armatimonadetes bacterium]|nr:hypothetical protein [Armatimonadota bacterium]
MSYAQWKEKEYAVASLLLDPKNPRLPSTNDGVAQVQLISVLVKHDDVLELAKDIADKGYYPVERLIVVEEQGKRYVVEGNRRLAALKLLSAPELAPEDYRRRFEALSKKVAASGAPKKAKVTVAPSRQEAYGFILDKHTRVDIDKWSHVQQARFYKTLMNSGMSAETISTAYSISLGEIAKFMQMEEMYSIACSLDLPPDVAEKVQDSRNFPVTTLERIYQRPSAQKFLCIEFDGNKRLVGKVHIDEFKKGYERIVSDIATGKADSRKLNDNPAIDKYLGTLSASKPDSNKKGSFGRQDFGSAGAGAPAVTPTKPGTKKSAHKPRSLVPRTMKCTASSERVRCVFSELRGLKVADCPNAVGIMLRVLLEMSLGCYLSKTGKLKLLLEKENERLAKKGKSPRPKDWSPTLHDMMSYMLNHDPDVQLAPTARKAISHLISGNDTIYREDLLHALVHSPHMMLSEPQLRVFWEQLEPIFQLTLVEPEIEEK